MVSACPRWCFTASITAAGRLIQGNPAYGRKRASIAVPASCRRVLRWLCLPLAQPRR